jgi:SAM-dependent methyltransferase
MTSNQQLVWTPEMVRRFWAYERTRPENFFSHQVGRVLVRRFRKHLAGRVLDYGCGLGFLIDDMLSEGISCGGVEFTSDFVAQLTASFDDRQGFLGIRVPDDFSDWRGAFDAIFLVEVIEHLYDDELQKTVASIHNLLRPGGILLVTTPNNENRSKNFICSPESGHLFHRFQHVRSWNRESLASFLTRHNFTVMEAGETDFGAHILALGRTRPFFYRLVRAIAKKFNTEAPHLYAIAAKAEGAFGTYGGS